MATDPLTPPNLTTCATTWRKGLPTTLSDYIGLGYGIPSVLPISLSDVLNSTAIVLPELDMQPSYSNYSPWNNVAFGSHTTRVTWSGANVYKCNDSLAIDISPSSLGGISSTSLSITLQVSNGGLSGTATFVNDGQLSEAAQTSKYTGSTYRATIANNANDYIEQYTWSIYSRVEYSVWNGTSWSAWASLSPVHQGIWGYADDRTYYARIGGDYSVTVDNTIYTQIKFRTYDQCISSVTSKVACYGYSDLTLTPVIIKPVLP